MRLDARWSFEIVRISKSSRLSQIAVGTKDAHRDLTAAESALMNR
jgi:hypothetical protein